MNVASLAVGSKVAYDGGSWTVVALTGGRATIEDQLSSQTRSVLIPHLLSAPGSRLLDALNTPPEPAVGPLFANLSQDELRELSVRAAHLREVITGYRSGQPGDALPGEPQPEYRPGVAKMDRYRAKAREMGVGLTSLRRWVTAYESSGEAGLIDARRQRRSEPLKGIDPRWLDELARVLDEHVDASRPVREVLLDRVDARVTERYGVEAAAVPKRWKAKRALAEVSRGTNALTGSTKGKRSIANRPPAPYGKLVAVRPGEYLLLDTTTLDVFAMDSITLRWVRVELTVAVDLFSRSIVALRLSPVSTKAVDAALVLFEAICPCSAARTGGGILPYPGMPSMVVIAPSETEPAAGLPGVAPETVIVDHGKIYVSAHLRSVCARLGISIQPARPFQPTDKAVVERFFRTVREDLLAALPGYKGPDVYSRGEHPEDLAYYFVDELEQIIREWAAERYHRRPHQGLVHPDVPGLALCPNDAFEMGIARAGRLLVPVRADLAYDFLPVEWRTIQHYGVQVFDLRYKAKGDALNAYRNRRSKVTGPNAGKWPIRYDPDDVTRVFFQDPATNEWHTLWWEHHNEISVPFSAEVLIYARQLARQTERFPDDRRALAELLERWGAGLTRNPKERRMALRLCQQRNDRLMADGDEVAGVTELVSVRAVAERTAAPVDSGESLEEPAEARGGDDDDAAELDAAGRRAGRGLLQRRVRELLVTTDPAGERDYTLSRKAGWFTRAEMAPRVKPEILTRAQVDTLGAAERIRYDDARAVWHANLGPIVTPQMERVLDDLEQIVESNRQDGDRIRSSAVLSAHPGLGKTTTAVSYGVRYHREQIEIHGRSTSGGHDRIPVAYVGLTSNTTMRSLNSALCRFFDHPGWERGTAAQLADRATDCVLSCNTRLIIIDDVHFLDMNRRDGREVANHFKSLAGHFPATFLFVGVGVLERQLPTEGLNPADSALAQTARRWTVLSLSPFEINTLPGRETWRRLLLSIERDIVLAEATRGMLADDLADYLFARSTGHFASLMTLITRGCRRAIKTRTERLTPELLDHVKNDAAAERARQELHAAFGRGILTTRVSRARAERANAA